MTMGSDGMTNTEKAIEWFEIGYIPDDEFIPVTEALRALRIVQKMEGEPVLDLMRENAELKGEVARLTERPTKGFYCCNGCSRQKYCGLTPEWEVLMRINCNERTAQESEGE